MKSSYGSEADLPVSATSPHRTGFEAVHANLHVMDGHTLDEAQHLQAARTNAIEPAPLLYH